MKTEAYKEGQKSFWGGNWENPYTPDTPENKEKMNDWDDGFCSATWDDPDHPLNPK